MPPNEKRKLIDRVHELETRLWELRNNGKADKNLIEKTEDMLVDALDRLDQLGVEDRSYPVDIDAHKRK
jgi:hypothetical protein